MCWCCASLSDTPACVVSRYHLYLLVWCHTIGIAFLCGASLSAMRSGVLLYYRSCVLVCCLTIGHALFSDVSLSTVPVCVLPHCNRHFTSQLQIEGLLQVWYYLLRGVIASDMFADLVLLSDSTACTVHLCQTCILGSFIQIRMFVKSSDLLQIH